MVLATSAGGAPLETAAFARVNAALVENHVLPRYARLAAATDAFTAASRGFCAAPGGSGDTRSDSGALPGRHGGLDGGRAPALRPHRNLDARPSLLLLAPGAGQGDRGGSQAHRDRRRSRGSPVTHQPGQRGHPGSSGRGGAPLRRRNVARREAVRTPWAARCSTAAAAQHARDGRGPSGRLARRQRSLSPGR